MSERAKVGSRGTNAVIEGSGVPPELTTEGASPAADGAAAEDPAAAPAAPPEAAPPAEPAAAPPTVAPASVTVDVLNGTATTGLAATVADLLRGQGFVVGAVGNEPGTVNETVVRYGPEALEQARTVVAAVPGAVLQPSDSIGNTVQLVIGPGYSTVVPVVIGAAAAPEQPAAGPADPTVAAQPADAAPRHS